MKNKLLSGIGLIICISIVFSFFLTIQPKASAQSYPSTWTSLGTDGDENGTADDTRDVSNFYYGIDSSYIYLRLTTRATPGWVDAPGGGFDPEDNRYKWFFDLDGDMNLQGGDIRNSEFLLFTEDTLNNTSGASNEDALGEIYFLNDTNNDGNYGEFESPSDYHGMRVTNTAIANFRITGTNMDMYILRSKVNMTYSSPLFCVGWATDQEDNNLDSASTHDRPDSGTFCFNISIPTVCGNGIVEGSEQCDGGACCKADCTFQASSTVCRAANGGCDVADYCTGTSATCPGDSVRPSGYVCAQESGQCDADDTCDGTHTYCNENYASSGTSCDDGLFCNVGETCNGLGQCTGGTARSCSANNIAGIATCDNNPDNVHYTWDSRNPFTSICNEATDICTTGSQTITHTCNKATCGAQCETNGDCNDNNAQTIDTCNLASCGCEHVAPKAVPTMSPILMISLLASLVTIGAKRIKV